MRIRQTVPSTGWYAVLALAVVAALGAATVVGAGLSSWRGGVAQRVVGAPAAPILKPGAAVVTVPPPTRSIPSRTHSAAPVAPPSQVLAARHFQQPAPATHVIAAPSKRPAAPAPAQTRLVVTPVTVPLQRIRLPRVIVPVQSPLLSWPESLRTWPRVVALFHQQVELPAASDFDKPDPDKHGDKMGHGEDDD